jgi:choline trimethylamine-lyase
MFSPRIQRLRAEAERRRKAGAGHMLLDAGEQAAYARLAHAAYSSTRGRPEAARKAAFLARWAAEGPVAIADDELIVGSQRFNAFTRTGGGLSEAQLREMEFHGNIGHIVVDYARVLRLGVCGLREELGRMPAGAPAARANRDAFAQALEAFAAFVRRHADAARAAGRTAPGPRQGELAEIAAACDRIADQPPRTFREALQLTWFVQVFLHAEGCAVAYSFGRLDQYLWPFLEADLQRRTLTGGTAVELLACFLLKCCEGDESQNLIVGGVDADGRPAENPLTALGLDTMRELRAWQPSLSIRIHAGTDAGTWEAALRLCEAGFGMPSFFNDPVVIRGLEAAGIPPDRARDWAIVGCYEATPQGDAYPLTVAGSLCLPELLMEFLDTRPAPTDFVALVEGFKRHLAARYGQILKSFEAQWEALRAGGASPFESLCVTGCTESGRAAEEGGARFNLFGVNILGLGTTIDSLHVLNRLVFEERALDLAALLDQVGADFPDAALLSRCRRMAGKYGTDADAASRLAADLSRGVADLVLAHPFANGVRPYPGFFQFGADVHRQVRATPDGRRTGERLSYGAGPGIFVPGTDPTGILRSVAQVAHDRCACGNPLLLSLSRRDARGSEGRARLRHVIQTYFKLGGFHLHFNIADADRLRAAQAGPAEHSDLLVRISGFSAPFTGIDRRWQDALIERTERGL